MYNFYVIISQNEYRYPSSVYTEKGESFEKDSLLSFIKSKVAEYAERYDALVGKELPLQGLVSDENHQVVAKYQGQVMFGFRPLNDIPGHRISYDMVLIENIDSTDEDEEQHLMN